MDQKMKQRIGVVCRSQEHFEEIKRKFPAYFEYFDSVPIYLDKAIRGQEITRITTDEFKHIEEIKK